MEVFTTLVGSDDGKVYAIDTIAHAGGLWLVPHWLTPHGKPERRPERMIRLDTLPYKAAPEGYGAHFLLEDTPIPRSILFGQTPPEEAHGFEVVDQPDVTLPWSGGGLH